MNVTFSGTKKKMEEQKNFADRIKLRISKWEYYPGSSGWGLNEIIYILIRRGGFPGGPSGKEPACPLSGLSTKTLFRTENVFLAMWDKMVRKYPQSVVGFSTTRGRCRLQIPTCQAHRQRLSKSVSHMSLQRLNPAPLQLLTLNTPERVQGGVRHSVLQRIWWDRSWDKWMFSGTGFMISVLASPHI